MKMEYLSPSRLSRFAQCELSFYFKYVAPATYEDETTEWYASYGSLIHELLEKMAKGEISSWKAVSLYNEEFPRCYIPDEQRATYYSAGLGALERKATELESLKDKILGIEKEFSIPFDFALPPLHGFIDLIYEDDYGLVVRDYKTSRVYDGSLMKKQLQPFVYAIACKHLYGRYPYKFEFDSSAREFHIASAVSEVSLQLTNHHRNGIC